MTTLIAAIGANNELGANGSLLWHIPEDLRAFKARTMGRTLIMGRKTWESLPDAKLPGRRCIVVTRQVGYTGPDVVVSSVEEALYFAGNEGLVIGGGEIYQQMLPYATQLEITHVPQAFPDADTFFPHFTGEWIPTIANSVYNKEGKILFVHRIYRRK